MEPTELALGPKMFETLSRSVDFQLLVECGGASRENQKYLRECNGIFFFPLSFEASSL